MTTPFKVVRSTVSSHVGSGVAALMIIVLATLPLWDSSGRIRTPLVVVLLYLALAQMWNLLAGFAGLISIGQQMFVGAGMYALLTFAEVRGIDPWLSVLLAGVVSAALSVPVAMFAFRLSGGYFAIGTWVVAEVLRLVTNESGSLRGGDVRSLTRASLGGYSKDTREIVTYLLALALAVGGTLIVIVVLRSRLGLALRAVSDSGPGAQGLGVNVTATKFFVWVVCAFWTGAIGAVILLNASSTTSVAAFSVSRWTAIVIFIVIIGGSGSTIGPILGVMVYWFVDEQFAGAETWRFMLLGALAALMAMFSPSGLNGLLQRLRPFEVFPVSRRLEYREERDERED